MGKVARLACVSCACRGILRKPVQVAHIRTGYPDAGSGWREFGKAEKPHDWRTAPLCVNCHLDGPDAQHKANERQWWERLGVHPPAFCAALVGAFEAGESGDKIIRQAAAGAFRDCHGPG